MMPSDVCSTTIGSTALGGAFVLTDLATAGPAPDSGGPSACASGSGVGVLAPEPQPVSQQAIASVKRASPSNNNRAACIAKASLLAPKSANGGGYHRAGGRFVQHQFRLQSSRRI